MKPMDTKNRLVVVIVIMPPCPSPPLFTRAMHTFRLPEVFWVRLVPQFDYKLNATKLKLHVRIRHALTKSKAEVGTTRQHFSASSSMSSHTNL
jgi:hypothetical protein